MKNIKRILGLFVVVFLTVFTMTKVNAVDSTITFYKRNLKGVDQYVGSTTSYKWVGTSQGDRIGFCLNKVLAAPTYGSKLRLDRELTTPSLVYILNNGYGGNWNSSLLGNSYSADERYYVTQLAIWLAQGSLKTSNLNANGRLGSGAIALYNAASRYQLSTPKLSITNGGSMKLSSDGTKYVSNNITISGSGYSNANIYLINAPADAKVVVDGKENASGVKVPAGKSFYVSIPTSKVGTNMSIRVDARATGTAKKIYRYTAGSSSYQNIGLMYNEAVSVSASTTTTINPITALRITKVDVSSGSEVKLSGVKITVKNAAGDVVAS